MRALGFLKNNTPRAMFSFPRFDALIPSGRQQVIGRTCWEQIAAAVGGGVSEASGFVHLEGSVAQRGPPTGRPAPSGQGRGACLSVPLRASMPSSER